MSATAALAHRRSWATPHRCAADLDDTGDATTALTLGDATIGTEHCGPQPAGASAAMPFAIAVVDTLRHATA